MLGLDSKMTFGKHSGKTVQDLLEHHPDYLLWLRRPNTDRQPLEMTHDLHCMLDSIIYNGWRDSRDKPKFPKEISDKFIAELQRKAEYEKNANVQFNESRTLHYAGLWGTWA